MRILAGLILAAALAGSATAQPLDDKRLSVHTLVREDIFAGLLEDDAARMARGEANLQTLLVSRPNERATVLVWIAGGEVYHAVKAREAKKPAEYKRLYARAKAHWDEAVALKSSDLGVPATLGGVILLYGDRLAPEDRKDAWERAYAAYTTINELQGRFLDKLPPHMRGEAIGGLVQSAQRTGRTAEYEAGLERMLVLMKGTPYEPTAIAWKTNPKAAGKGVLACKQCHDEGRLQPTLARLGPAK